jgi:uncharacterized protein (TIGR03437 family)
VQATTASGGSWLNVASSSGTTPAILTIQFAVSGLAAGVYSGTIALASGGVTQTTINVTLTVVMDTGIVLQATPGALTFSAVAGGSAPPAQSVQVSAAGDALLFQANINAPPTGKWLTVTPGSAATNTTISVAVDPKGLAPATYAGSVTLGLSGISPNAQTIPVTFTVTAAPSLPTINTNGVLNAASLGAGIAPGTWVSIFGANLSATTRSWAAGDFVGGKLPTTIDNVSVTINGNPAPVAYVSPGQLNVLAPDDTTTGLVFAQVKSPAGSSSTALVLEQTAAPAFFQFHAPSTNYVAATHADNSILAGTALTQQGIVGTPAKPGETIVLYGTGFGATQPAVSATAPAPGAVPLANQQDLRVRIAGVDATVVFAGLVGPGLYQLNVVVPNVPDGDQTVSAELRGLATQGSLMLTIQR